MARKELKAESVAEAYLALLAERGVEYLFANAGTDFAPIVEAYAKAAHTGFPAPKPLIATHENLALSMAHGYAVASGKVPAVMVHVSVGTANALCGVFNAARANVPILFTAGRGGGRRGGGDPRTSAEPAGHHRRCRPRSCGRRGARRVCRAVRRTGRRAPAALFVSAGRSPLPSRLQPRRAPPGCRRDPRPRVRCALDTEPRGAVRRVQDRPYRGR